MYVRFDEIKIRILFILVIKRKYQILLSFLLLRALKIPSWSATHASWKSISVENKTLSQQSFTMRRRFARDRGFTSRTRMHSRPCIRVHVACIRVSYMYVHTRVCTHVLREKSSIHAAVCRSLFGNGGPFPWVNCSESDRKFRAA